VTGYETEIVCDFRSLYGCSFWDMVEEGDPGEASTLVSGLLLNPWSLYRARWFTTHPPQAGKVGTHLSWYGRTDLVDLVAAVVNNQVGKRVIDPPVTRGPTLAETTMAWIKNIVAGQRTQAGES